MTGAPEQAQNNPPSDEDAKKWGSHIMGPSAVRTVRPDNQKAASWSAADHRRQFFQSHHPYLQHSPVDKPSNNPFEKVGNMFNSWCTIAKVIARNNWHNLASSLPPRWSNEGQGLITAESQPLITAESHSMSRQVKGSRDRADGCGKDMLKSIRPPRPDWYEELYAWALGTFTKSYEAKVEDYKSLIFANLRGKAETVLEIGIGAGPNLKYYANTGVRVFGLDPNKKFEKYAQAAAMNVGLPPADFKFIHAVAEALPLPDASVDAVIGTLVLCSVKDVNMALKEVIRVLKPGGLYLFVEHVAGQDGSIIKFFQRVLDPLQKIISDGCHLTMTTGKHISEAGFSEVDLKMVYVPKAYFVSPHVYGVARK